MNTITQTLIFMLFFGILWYVLLSRGVFGLAKERDIETKKQAAIDSIITALIAGIIHFVVITVI